MINLNWKKIDTNETSMNWSNCQECCSSWRTSSQGTCQSSLSVKAQEEPHPKGPISLPQVSQLTKNLVPRNQSVCPKCPAHKESHPKGPISPTPSVKAHKEPCPMGPVSPPWVPMFMKNLIPRDLSVSLLLVLTLTKSLVPWDLSVCPKGICVIQVKVVFSARNYYL